MSLFGWLFGGKAKERLRHKGRYGHPGAFRKMRNGDRVRRGPGGKYKK